MFLRMFLSRPVGSETGCRTERVIKMAAVLMMVTALLFTVEISIGFQHQGIS
jgi:hypothetical protein